MATRNKSNAGKAAGAADKAKNQKADTEVLDINEPIIPVDQILNQAAGELKSYGSEEDIDEQYGNHIEGNKGNAANTSSDLGPGVSARPQAQAPVKPAPPENVAIATRNLPDEVALAIPTVRKVVIKKIERFKFKLNLEKAKLNLLPGAGHTWVPDKRGNEFVTGFDTGKFDKEKERLEKVLRVSLGPDSKYWETLKFRIEDKEHGEILNFDDPQMGAYYEAVYFGMLGSSLIANGYQEYATGVKPYAEWYIENKEAEAEADQANMTAESTAFAAFTAMSYAKRRNSAKLLALPAWTGSDNVISKMLWDFLKGEPHPITKVKTTSAQNCRDFNRIAQMHDTQIEISVLAMDAIKYNVIRKNRADEYYFADTAFGPTVDHIVQRLALPQYSEVRQALTNQLKLKAN